MTPTEAAILKTVLYGDVFDFALTVKEIHHFLIAESPICYLEIQHSLETSAYLKSVLERAHGYVVCTGRLEIIDLRSKREQITDRLWIEAWRYGIWLSRLPFVRMVALTGALAMRNPTNEQDDLDYILVTSARRVWMARAFSILLVRFVKLRGVVLCPNYVLAETALAQSKHDLFVAHEIAQMIPCFGQPLYAAMRDANAWTGVYLPNASASFNAPPARDLGVLWGILKRVAESLLGGNVGDWLENWEYRRKARRFAHEMDAPASAAQIDAQHVKGHFNDHGHPILLKYQERLRQYDLEALSLAGD